MDRPNPPLWAEALIFAGLGVAIAALLSAIPDTTFEKFALAVLAW